MRAVRDGESAVNGKLFGEHGGGYFVEASAAILLGNSAAEQTQFARFFHQFRHQARLFVLQILGKRKHLFYNKLFGGLSDKLLVVTEIGGRKYVLGSGGLEKKAAAFGCGFGKHGSGHESSPSGMRDDRTSSLLVCSVRRQI